MVKEIGRLRIFAELESAESDSEESAQQDPSGPSLWKVYVQPAWDRESNDPEVVIQIHESADQETWRYIQDRICEPDSVGYAPTPVFGLRSDRYYRVHIATLQSSSSAEETGLAGRTPLGYYVDDSSAPGPAENAQTIDSSYDGTTITVQKPEAMARIKRRQKRGK